MKKILLGIMLLLTATAAKAELQWMLVTDSGTQIPVAQVQCLVAADDAQTFSVLMKDGQGEAVTGVKSATFTQSPTTGVSTFNADGFSAIPDMISKSIIITGAQGQSAHIYSTDGKAILSAILHSQSQTIDVAGLPSGTYILTVGKASVKFIKK